MSPSCFCSLLVFQVVGWWRWRLTILIFLQDFHQVPVVQVELVFRCFFKVCNHSVCVQDDGPRDLCKKQPVGKSARGSEQEVSGLCAWRWSHQQRCLGPVLWTPRRSRFSWFWRGNGRVKQEFWTYRDAEGSLSVCEERTCLAPAGFHPQAEP